uniref:Lipid-binding serum glycoprotein C-terminal domain-containing protein n=1 Tax=Setaria digitata TaxID=48799 RepID=A0A915PJE8_9BILA
MQILRSSRLCAALACMLDSYEAADIIISRGPFLEKIFVLENLDNVPSVIGVIAKPVPSDKRPKTIKYRRMARRNCSSVANIFENCKLSQGTEFIKFFNLQNFLCAEQNVDDINEVNILAVKRDFEMKIFHSEKFTSNFRKRKLCIFKTTLWLAEIAHECHGESVESFVPLQSALRIRFGDDIFRQLSKVVEYLFKKHVKRVIIAPQHQCFAEGCVTIQDFQLVMHQSPSYVGVIPTPPNLLTLRINDFSFYITGTLYGQLQPLPLVPLTVPIFGTLVISANQLVIGATFDIQKTVDSTPYIRLVTCSLINDITLSRVENMGLFTAIVNTKYQNVDSMAAQKTKRALESEPNYLQIPVQLKLQMASQTDISRKLQLKRLNRLFGTSSYGDGIRPIILNSSSAVSAAKALQKSKEVFSSINNSSEILRRKLAVLIVSLDILDTGATYSKFFTGLDGDVYIKTHDQTRNPYRRPEMLQFTQILNRNATDLLISEYTINTLLLKAHSIGALVFNVRSTTPVLGKLIRTSCLIDEVCLSDVIPEIGEAYPNKQLEIILRTIQPPKAVISTGTATVELEGRALFLIEGTNEKLGVIPFRTEIQCNVVSLPGRITGLIKIKRLEFREHIDFFGLSLQSLNSLKEAAKGAVTKMVNEMLEEGVSLNGSGSAIPQFSDTSISLADRAILLQTNFDIERIFY